MTEKYWAILRTLSWMRHCEEGVLISAGEIAKYSKISYSSVRRALSSMEKIGLVERELKKYKSTGAWHWTMTQTGAQVHYSQRSLPTFEEAVYSEGIRRI